MSVPYIKYIRVAILSKRNLCAGHESAKVVAPHIWLYECNISPFIIRVFTELINVVSLGAIRMIKPLVKIPPTDAHLPAISSLNADALLVERLE